MKYSGRYSNKIDMSKFDEIMIQYDKQDRQLVDFLIHHVNQKVVLVIRDINDFYSSQEWKKLNAIKEKFPELIFSVCFGEIGRFETGGNELQVSIDSLVDIPYFTGDLVTNFDQLHYLCKRGISEVYLGEDICFDLWRAKQVASSYGVKIRTFPNVGQCSVKSGLALKKFFIRPEDVEEYSDCIDTLEFWGPLDRQGTLLKIYKKGIWFGDLQELLLDFDLSFDSRRIVPGFAQMRKTCQRKCMKGESCTICDRVYLISKKLEDKELIIKRKKTH